MSSEWLNTKGNNGVCGADSPEEHNPNMTEIRNDYRWTPACQRAFLEVLAYSGSVMRAAKEVAKSARSAYDLRFRRDGAAFRLGWDAAILVSRYALQDMLMDRAVNGYEEVSSKQDDGVTMRGRFDNRLGKGLLDRLDRMASAQALKGSRDAQIQLVCDDFEGFLELIGRGGKGAEAALFFEARDPGGVPDSEKHAIGCELERISAAENMVPDMFDEEPEVAAERLGVWFDENRGEWRTNFPKPEDDDSNCGIEIGFFGDKDYDRPLTQAEQDAHIAALHIGRKPWVDAGCKARDAWFGVKMAA